MPSRRKTGRVQRHGGAVAVGMEAPDFNALKKTPLILAKAYVQVLTHKGYRYLDDSGVIANRYADAFPDISINLDGMRMTDRNAIIDEIKVSVSEVWISFTTPPTASFVNEQAWQNVQWICSAIGVSEARGFGLRLQYIDPWSEEENESKIRATVERAIGPAFAGIGVPPRTFQAGMDVTLPDSTLFKVLLAPAERGEGGAESVPERGLLLDVDARMRSGDPVALAELRSFLRRAWVHTVEVLPRVYGEIGKVRSDEH